VTASALAVPATGRNVSFRPARVPIYVYVLSIGLALQFMSGEASNFGFPIAPDRFLIPAGIVLFLIHPDRRRRTWKVRPIHLALLVAALWCLASMIWFGTIASQDARYGFWDSYGVMPFVLFTMVPVIYETTERRRILLVVMTSLGAYLGLIAAFQGLRLEFLIFPRYMVDPQSAHFGRAFGPSLQVGSNGLQLFACMVCAAILSTQVAGLSRWASRGVAFLCAAGLFFTMTRSLWLGGIAGILVALWLDRRTRKMVLALVIVVPIAVLGVLAVDQTLQDMVTTRLNDAQSAYDRINASETALRILQFRPFFGVGYYNFWNVENDWFWQLDTTPVAATGIAVHNVFLGLAAELGIPGATAWLLGLMGGAKGLLRRLPASREALMWRQAALGYFVCWFTAAMLMPITYPLPSSLLWIFLGIVLTPADVGFGAYVAASLPAQVCEPAPVIARSEADLLGAL
jgi:putative inorganic carbon (HCO3(-)) transporter